MMFLARNRLLVASTSSSAAGMQLQQNVRALSFLSRIFGKKKDDNSPYGYAEEGTATLPPNTNLPASISTNNLTAANADQNLRRRRHVISSTGAKEQDDLEQAASRKGETWLEMRNRKSSFNPDDIFEERIMGSGYPKRGPGPHPEKRLREWSHNVQDMTLGPKKLNLVAKLIRRLPVEEARLQLRFCKKQVSRDVLLALDQAVIKAREEADMHAKDLIVGQCWVGGKIAFKKVDIKARGKSGTIQKRLSSLTVVLYENPALVPGFFSKVLTPTKSEHKGSRRALFKPEKVKKLKDEVTA